MSMISSQGAWRMLLLVFLCFGATSIYAVDLAQEEPREPTKYGWQHFERIGLEYARLSKEDKAFVSVAVSALQESVGKGCRNVSTLETLLNLYTQQDRSDMGRVAGVVEEFLKLAPGRARECQLLFSRILERNEDLAGAVEAMKAAIDTRDMRPEDVLRFWGLWGEYVQGREAIGEVGYSREWLIGAVERALAQEPDKKVMLYYIMALQQWKSPEKFKQTLETALASARGRDEEVLALHFLLQGHSNCMGFALTPEEELRYRLRLLRIKKNSDSLYRPLRILWQQERYAEIVSLWREIELVGQGKNPQMSREDSATDSRMIYGRSLLALKQPGKALEQFRILETLYPRGAFAALGQACDLQARCLIELADGEQAARCLERALRYYDRALKRTLPRDVMEVWSRARDDAATLLGQTKGAKR